nr:carboxypeptidase regulatory-like domain-containing protein [Deltaproteobacteria bacterium]
DLAPGRYTMRATFAGQPIDVTNIDVRAGEITLVDLVFTLGRPDPISIDHSVLLGSEIARYRPKQLTASQALIEGTVTDIGTRQRVPGAVVTAVHASGPATTEHTVSDDQGRYRFEAMPPGTYSISAYYSVGGRGQIEVRRSGIEVAGAEAVSVPLWIEMQR